MISLSRQSLGVIAVLYGLYHAFLGVVSLTEYENAMPVAAAIFIYMACLVWVLAEKEGIRMRLTSAFVVLLLMILVSYLVFNSLDGVRQSSYTTWHIAAVSTVLAVITIRQYPAVGWLGLTILILQTLGWGGPEVIFNSGILGGVILVSVSQAASWAIISSANSAADFRKKSLQIDAAIDIANAARATRIERLEQTLNDSLPLLTKIREKEGSLSDSDKKYALLLEAELRDRIRARHILNDDVVLATRNARARGVEVQLLDDGGLDDLSDIERLPYLSEISTRLALIQSGKVVIRAVKGEDWRLTMAAIRKDTDRPDLFIRL